MSVWALELDDRTLATAHDGVRLAGPAGGMSGANAELAPREAAASRHWFEFATARRPASAILAAVAADVSEAVRTVDGTLRIATPSRFEPAALGQLLGLLRAESRAVAGFVDAATVTVAALGLSRSGLVVDFGRQHIAVARVDVLKTELGTIAHRRRVLSGERGGAQTLVDAWLDLVSDAMVRRTRFDPLHDQATERAVRAAVPGWARAAARDGEVVVSVEQNGQRYQVTLSRDQFATPAQPLFRELAGLLHELRPAGAQLDIVLPQALAELPGAREALELFVGCELWTLPDGFAACAACSLPETAFDAAGVRLLRRLPVAAQADLVGLTSRQLLGRGAGKNTVPTHVLFAGQARALGTAPIEVGRDPGVDGIRLPDGLAGVSRFHCCLRRDDAAVVLIDCSRFGTFVNGERVAGRVQLRAGDSVRIGDPGVELNLIAVGGD